MPELHTPNCITRGGVVMVVVGCGARRRRGNCRGRRHFENRGQACSKVARRRDPNTTTCSTQLRAQRERSPERDTCPCCLPTRGQKRPLPAHGKRRETPSFAGATPWAAHGSSRRRFGSWYVPVVVTAHLGVHISWAPWNSGHTKDWGKCVDALFGHLIHPRALPLYANK